MNNKVRWIIYVFLLVLVIVGATVLYNNFKDKVENNKLQTPPPQLNIHQNNEHDNQHNSQTNSKDDDILDFTVYDKNGNETRLSSMKGKPTVINFWATWCPYCVEEMPEFEELYKKYGDEIHFMMINSTDGYQETEQKAKQFIKEKGYTFPVYYDLDFDASKVFYVQSLPVTYFIDADGNPVTYANGRLDKQTLEKGINMIKEIAYEE